MVSVVNWFKGVVRKLFSLNTIKTIIGQDAAITADMVNSIELWASMLRGKAPWITGPVNSLRLEQGICREFANISLNEMESRVTNENLNRIYEYAIRDINENLQAGLALGSFVIKPLGGDKVEYITADKFIPIEFDSRGRLINVVFIETRRIRNDSIYYRFEQHDLSRGMLIITNQAYHSSSDNAIGVKVPLQSVDDWSVLPERVIYKIDKPDFGYYRNPILNTIDGSACGVSIYDAAVRLIEKTDIQFGRLDWEFESGERAVHVDVSALKTENNKSYLPRLNRRLYRGINNIDPGMGKDLFDVFSPEFRDQSIINGLEEYKRNIEFAIGLAYGDLSKPESVEKTATEVRTAKKRKYNTVTAIQNNLRDCLSDLVDALAFYNGMTTSGYEFVCEFKDSILTDEETERQQDILELQMGILRPEEYRAKWKGETLDEAFRNLPQQAQII